MVLAYLFLALLHAIYSLVILSISFCRHLTRKTPSPLNATRRRLPEHLSIIFVSDGDFDERTNEFCITESIHRAISWCQQLGIPQLSVYDAEGIILNNAEAIREVIFPENRVKHTGFDQKHIHYPPTPPLSDYSESRPLSPEDVSNGHIPFLSFCISPLQSASRASKKSQSLTLNVLSREASKPSVARTARAIAKTERRDLKYSKNKSTFELSVDSLQNSLEGNFGLSPPDFMIIHPVHPSKYHRSPIELHGYPPWQIRLTEIYCNRFRKQYEARLMWFLPSHVSSTLLSSSLTEWEFREALDQFASAEFRLGK
ncbi:hypothetical protein EV361DRAFT_489522 [Lentinula raphanica]|uniref:ditrans,polycis-polyprenyl diphosphate synthase [(2E,6E)-farnesyldiphosphate specific] n=1 Tax=Lentinula raphanica TaxID=153919 RepID=A0AA38PEC1_9AGAR|nr:hypothetical protein F5880DRAFT_505570 [Lentinula raphanica]KAJ3841357.1 hypothetical protein F5878DRAFT_17142 [Lentinula raphanica]KAJ3975467.1 hypothetical protein EV361DRAFT_489522 [Lentinula raphanica]